MKYFMHDILSFLQTQPARPVLREVFCEQEKRITCQMLYDMIAGACTALYKAGVRPGDRVVISAENSTACLAADLAVFTIGAVNILLNNRLRFDEVYEISTDAEAVLVISDEPDLGRYLSIQKRRVPSLMLQDLTSEPSRSLPIFERDLSKPILLHYKFDINGHPLGVTLTGNNMNYIIPVFLEMLLEYKSIHGMKMEKRTVFHYLPLYLLPARLAVYSILQCNNSLILCMQPEKIQSLLHKLQPHCFLAIPATLNRFKIDIEKKVLSEKLSGWLYKQGLQAYNLKYAGEKTITSSISYAMIKSLLFAKLRKTISPRLKFIINALDPLSEETQKWYHMLGIKIYQAFGQEETSGLITRDKPHVEWEPGYVGFKLRDTEIELTPQQELICRGPNIFSGYWRNPTATAEVLQQGWYHTGIIADACPDGNWIIVGRMQNLIVLTSGHNIAPEPIEKRIIENFTAIKQAVLIGDAKPFLSLIVSGDITPRVLEAEIEKYNKDLPHYLQIGGYFISPVELNIKNELVTENLKLKRKEITGYFSKAIERIYHNNR